MKRLVFVVVLLAILVAAPTALAAPQPECTGTTTVTCTFPYTDQVTDGPYQWVVPPGVTSVTVSADGAQGGGAQNATAFFSVGAQGGRGARVTAAHPVTPGETLTVAVGAQGAAPDAPVSTNAFGGGGAAGNRGASGVPVVGGNRGAGGGGASVVRRGTVLMVVAGGGGGSAAQAFTSGGASGTAGASGNAGGGQPGSSLAGGAGGAGSLNPDPGSCLIADDGPAGGAGSSLAGGDGAVGGGYGGGGGGGGLFGGGAGGNGWFGQTCSFNSGPAAGQPGGGGGGSSSTGFASGTITNGARAGDGLVTITYSVGAASGSISGNRVALDGTVDDLTTAGTTDWAVWGYGAGGTSTSLAPDVRKVGGSAISDLTDVNPTGVQRRGIGFVSEPPFLLSWSDGDTVVAASSAQTGLQHNGFPTDQSALGTGFSFTVPADTSERTLSVWVAQNRAGGELRATLSDGSAPAYVDAYDVGFGDFLGSRYTIVYRAGSPGQTLTVSWIETVDNCPDFRCDNVSIHAVTLSGGGGGGGGDDDQAGPTFTVNSTGADDGACTVEDCTLEEAIDAANAHPNGTEPDVIAFSIPGEAPHLITRATNLPDIGEAVLIDGTTQPGYGTAHPDFGPAPAVEVRGPGAGTSSQAFFGAANGVVVRGLSITGWGMGVVLLGSGAVDRSWLGLQPGAIARENDLGVALEGSNASVTASVVQGGECGVVVAGRQGGEVQEVCGHSVSDASVAPAGNVVGGSADVGDGNRIFGFRTAGVLVSSTGAGNRVQGNSVGLGGDDVLAGAGAGIDVVDAPGTVVGADAGPGDGFTLDPWLGNVVAGVRLGDPNVGVRAAASPGTRIAANIVGTTRDGAGAGLGVDGPGISVSGSGVQIGPSNHVTANTGDGVVVTSGDGNRIVANGIHDNGGLGIRLVGTANRSLAAPVISSFAGGMLSGTVSGVGGQSFFVETFLSDACDPSGAGEGETYSTFVSVTIPVGSTQAPFSIEYGVGAADGRLFTATATDMATNDTSPFSDCVGETVGATVAPALSGTASVTAGAGVVPLDAVPPEALRTGTGPSSTAVEGAPLSTIPLSTIPLSTIPLSTIPLSTIGLRDVAGLLQAVPLSTIPLSTIPLSTIGTFTSWQELLEGTTFADDPIQGLTLGQLFQATGDALLQSRLAALPLSTIQLSESILGSLSPAAIGLGTTPLSTIPVEDEAPADPQGSALENWCEWLSGPPVNCTSPSQIAGASVLSVSLQGAPLSTIPVGSIPLSTIPLSTIPLSTIPLSTIDLAASPLSTIPLSTIPLSTIAPGAIPLSTIPLSTIPLSTIPLSTIPLSTIPLSTIQALFGCTGSACDTSGTLGSRAGDIVPGSNVTLGGLLAAIAPADLAGYTLLDLFLSLPQSTLEASDLAALLALVPAATLAEFTLDDLLALALSTAGTGWEKLDLQSAGLSRIATPAPGAADVATIDLRIILTPTGAPGLTVASAEVTLPEGFSYVPGSATLQALDASPAPAAPGEPEIAGATLTWPSLALEADGDYRLRLRARAGITLGDAGVTASVTPTGGPTAAAAPFTVEVTDTFEPNGDPVASGLAPLTDTAFNLSYVASAGDVDYYTFPVPAAGTRVTFRLSHLPVDYDLVVYGPGGQQLIPPVPGTPPIGGQVLPDDGVTLQHQISPLAPESLDDIVIANLPVLGLSTHRGLEEDAVTVLSKGGVGTYTIQVSGFNGATSDQPYMLRPDVEPPLNAASCTPRAGITQVAPASGRVTSGPLSAVNTVFVVNASQLNGLYPGAGAAAVTDIEGRLASLAALGFPGVVMKVDSDPAVRQAYDQWNACPSSAEAANAVVTELGRMLRSLRQDAPGLKYVTLVGGDASVPFARLGDFTTVAFEGGYAGTFDPSSAVGGALGSGHLLSDDPYGDIDPVPFLDRQLFVPELAVGRLVETPAEIAGTVARFSGFGGQLAPTTLTTGYDFLTDGAEEVKQQLDRIAPAASDSLIDQPGTSSWTAAQLRGKWVPTGGPFPDITAVNGHADHSRFEPSAGEPYFATSDLPLPNASGAQPFDGKLVMSMGCHAGLSVTDVDLVDATGVDPADWAQRLSGLGATFAGNTGYGYGDTDVVAYSESLQVLFARNLADGMMVGEALAYAKQEYFGSLSIIGVYDEKASAELTLYGLPMWRFPADPAGPAPAAASAPASGEPSVLALGSGSDVSEAPAAPISTLAVPDSTTAGTDAATGLPVIDLSLSPTHTQVTGPRGTYLRGDDGVIVEHWRPIQPKAILPVTAADAHGALVTSLTSIDEPVANPVYARPIVDESTIEPEAEYDEIVFPARLQAVTRQRRPDGSTRTSVVLATGQFLSNGLDGTGAGTQRRFSAMGVRVFRSPSDDWDAPTISRAEKIATGPDRARFSVDVTDAAGATAGTVRRVVVAYLDGTGWHFVDLASVGGTTWERDVLTDTLGARYFVQAVDAAGNVGVTTNKGFYYSQVTPPASTGATPVTVTPTTVTPPSGWFTGAASVRVLVDGAPAPTDGSVDVKVDDGAFAAYTGPVAVSGDGVHLVTARIPDGSTGSLVVKIDTVAPVITITRPANGEVVALGQAPIVSCVDAQVGPVPCTYGELDGNGPFVVTAVDDAGNEASASRTYTVVDPIVATLVPSTPTGTNGWYRTPVRIAVESPRGVVPPPGRVTVSFDGGPAIPYDDANRPVVPEGTHTAVITTSLLTGPAASVTLGPIKVDTVAPQVTVTTPPAGASYTQGQAVTTAFTCTDATSGLTVPCTGVSSAPGSVPAPSGAALPTATGGALTFTVTATDNAGNVTTVVRPYTVTTFSVDGRIVFSRLGDLWAVTPAGVLTQLTSGPAVDLTPARSPDGRRVVFSRNGDLWILDVNGAAALTAANQLLSIELSPAWSPDGQRIVFSSNRSGSRGTDIWSVSANGTGSATNLTNTNGTDVTPAWSPDGASIVFSSDRPGQFDVYRMPATGGAVTRLTTSTAADVDPVYAPDGSAIAFASNRNGGAASFDVYRMTPAGGSQTRLTTAAAADGEPYWVPGGPAFGSLAGRIVFTSLRLTGGGPGLWQMTSTGTGQARIPQTGPIDVNPG